MSRRRFLFFSLLLYSRKKLSFLILFTLLKPWITVVHVDRNIFLVVISFINPIKNKQANVNFQLSYEMSRAAKLIFSRYICFS